MRRFWSAVFYVPAIGWQLWAQNPTRELNCEAHFFEAYFQMPQDERIRRELWQMPEAMHRNFTKPPLASYVFFRRLESQNWQLELLKPLRLTFPFLQRFELTFLESRVTSLGQVFYRFDYKVNHLTSATLTLDAGEIGVLFLRHAKTHDEFLYLACSSANWQKLGML